MVFIKELIQYSPHPILLQLFLCGLLVGYPVPISHYQPYPSHFSAKTHIAQRPPGLTDLAKMCCRFHFLAIILVSSLCKYWLLRAKSLQSCLTLWTVARQAPPSVGFSRQEHWSGLPCPPPGDLPDPGIEPESLTSPALADGFLTTSAAIATCIPELSLSI